MSTTDISAGQVKQLRDRTGAGMMECKRALQESGGDIDAAVVLLRERGMAQAGKRADRATTEGLVGSIVRDGIDGFIVPVRDVEALTQRIEHLYGDVTLRLAMAAQARARAMEFPWERYQQGAVRLVDAIGRVPEAASA